MKYLIEVTEVYRVDTEREAAALIEEAKKQKEYVLLKYSSIQKERKEKKEVVETWFKVSLVKRFTSEKEPEDQYNILYKNIAYGDKEGALDEDEDIK